MTTEQVKARLLEFRQMKDDFRNEVKQFVTNKEVPLDDRWNLFIDSKTGKHEKFIYRFETLGQFKRSIVYKEDLNEALWNDYLQKHEVMHVSMIIDTLEEALEECEEFYKSQELERLEWQKETPDEEFPYEEYDPEYNIDLESYFRNGESFNRDNLNELKEEILSKMIKSYSYYW